MKKKATKMDDVFAEVRKMAREGLGRCDLSQRSKIRRDKGSI